MLHVSTHAALSTICHFSICPAAECPLQRSATAGSPAPWGLPIPLTFASLLGPLPACTQPGILANRTEHGFEYELRPLWDLGHLQALLRTLVSSSVTQGWYTTHMLEKINADAARASLCRACPGPRWVLLGLSVTILTVPLCSVPLQHRTWVGACPPLLPLSPRSNLS